MKTDVKFASDQTPVIEDTENQSDTSVSQNIQHDNNDVLDSSESVPSISDDDVNLQNNVENEDNASPPTPRIHISLPKVKDVIKYKLNDNDDWIEANVISRGGKSTGKNRAWFNVLDKGSIELKSVNFESVAQWQPVLNPPQSATEAEVNAVFVPTSRHMEHNVYSAKLRELDNWKKFSVYDEVTDHGQSFMTTRWVVTEKRQETEPPVIKARLVARGFEENNSVQSDSPTATKETLRIFLTIASSFEWQCHTIDIKAAFLQGLNIEREIHLKPPVEADSDGKLWKLNKCVYGLTDASRTWYFRVKEELLSNGCQQSTIDPAFFYWYYDNKLSGVFMIHVDDFIWAGIPQFESSIINQLRLTFEIGKQFHDDFKYIGLNIKQEGNCIIMDQYDYIDELKPVSVARGDKTAPLHKDEINQLRSVIGQINWVSSQTRPDLSFDHLDLSVSIKHPTVHDLQRASKMITKLKTSECHIKFSPLTDMNNVRFGVYSDASYGNLSDGFSSAAGYIIFLYDVKRNCCPLTWKSKKIQRVVKSTLAAETLSLVEALDTAIYLGHILTETLFKKKGMNAIPIDCFIDNKSLFDNIYSTKLVQEKRLRIDIASVKQMLDKREIDNIQWVDSAHQLSDCFTKKGASCIKLINVLSSGSF